MKKLLSLTLVLCLALVLVACSTGVAAAADVKTGLGIVTSIASSTPVGEKDGEKTNGNAQVDSTICAVTLDANGVILTISFDVAQTKIAFSPEGAIVSDPAAEIRSKKELKDDYGMKNASGIGLEVYEQIANLEKFAVGKTVAEVLATPTYVKDDHHTAVPDAADLKTAVTISIGDYLKALEKAAANAQ
ncbi:MAG: hypothetical protein LBU67_01625 [Oscillospiraceae bacterium]|jgi:hypothetical protein|nr:hypothetical protein [Oscillospiraceae bacterium]